MLQCDTVCYSMLQDAAVFCRVLQCVAVYHKRDNDNNIAQVLQCVAACCNVLQSILQYIAEHLAVYCSVLQCVAACCSVSQCVAVCCRASCSVLQGVAVCHKKDNDINIAHVLGCVLESARPNQSCMFPYR